MNVAAGVRTNFGDQQTQIDQIRARSLDGQTLDRAGNRHQYNLNTIKIAKPLDKHDSFDQNVNDVTSFQNFSNEFTSLNNPSYGPNQKFSNQVSRQKSQADMYDKVKQAASRRINLERDN